MLAEVGAPADVVVAPLDRGAVLPGAHLALIAEADLTGRRRVHRTPRGARQGPGLLRGARRRVTSSCTACTASAGTSAWRRARCSASRATGSSSSSRAATASTSTPRTSGSSASTPAARSRSCRRWAAPTGRRRARGCARPCATSRPSSSSSTASGSATPGHAFAADGPFQQQIEDAFPYEETPDQLKAIEETKADMERSDPDGPAHLRRRRLRQDRGRAAGRGQGRVRRPQVAVLVPTTLLASQHGQTFRERFANYPVRVEVLSRFLSAKEQNEVVKGVAGRPASTSSSARTGCSRTTSCSRTSGCSSSTKSSASACSTRSASRRCAPTSTCSRSRATPIPRTLEMSLTGIRDLSLVQTPPEDRQPILTYVGEYDARAASEAIRRELLREGQVLFVHNRVRDIAARRGRRTRARARRARRGRARPDGREVSSNAS